MVFPKIGISRFFRDFTQKIGISDKIYGFQVPAGALKSIKMREIPFYYQIPIFGKPHGKGPGQPYLDRVAYFFSTHIPIRSLIRRGSLIFF